jgi:diacylglycerol kinase family enzyme
MNQEAGGAMRLLVLVNPVSGQGRGADAAVRLPGLLKKKGLSAEVVVLEGPGAARKWVRERGRDFDAVVAVGGDGTIAETAGAAYETKLGRPVGLIPLGLSNCLARHLDLPRDLEAMAEVLARGRTRAVDLALLPGGVSLSFIGVGFDAAVVHRVAEARRGTVRDRDYVAAALGAVFRDPWPRFHVTVDGKELPGLFFQAILTGITNYAHYFNIPRDRGYSAYLFRGKTALALARSFARLGWPWSLVRGADLVAPIDRTIRMESEGEGGWCQFDGEAGRSLPVQVDIQRNALDFFVP